MNSSDDIAPSPEFTGNHYFFGTSAAFDLEHSMIHCGVCKKKNERWD